MNVGGSNRIAARNGSIVIGEEVCHLLSNLNGLVGFVKYDFRGAVNFITVSRGINIYACGCVAALLIAILVRQNKLCGHRVVNHVCRVNRRRQLVGVFRTRNLCGGVVDHWRGVADR